MSEYHSWEEWCFIFADCYAMDEGKQAEEHAIFAIKV